VVFLHEELMKLPSFPRKALEADLDLYKGGEMGKVSLPNFAKIFQNSKKKCHCRDKHRRTFISVVRAKAFNVIYI
jgi:hypothetical protein